MSAGAPPKGSMLAGFAIFNTVIGEISLGYGSAMTMVVGLFIALCLAGLYLVIVRPRRRVIAPDRDDGLDGSPIRTDPRAWARLRRDPLPGGAARPDVPPDVTRTRPSGPSWATTGAHRLRRSSGTVLAAAATLLLVVGLAGPLVWIAIASTQPPAAVAQMPPRLTASLDLSAYGRLISDPAWQGAAVVSIAVTVIATLIALGVSLLAGYPLARFRIRGATVLLLFLLVTMLIPPIALAIPVLYLVIDLGIRDTIVGLVLINAAFWSPILIWLVRGAFLGVPVELERAARMDGSSRLGAILRITLPAAAPVIAAATAIVFIGIWNDYVFVAVVGGRETHTLPRFLGESASPALQRAGRPDRSDRRSVHRDHRAAAEQDPRAPMSPADEAVRPLVIVNPRASRLADPKRRDQIVKAATAAVAHRFGVAPLIEEGGIQSTRAALAADPAPPLVVVVGGDGTVREAAAALIGREVPIAVIPAGTGNVLAGALGIGGVRSGVDVIRTGRTQRLDLGRARWRRDRRRSGAAGRSPGTALHGRLRDGPRRTDDGGRRTGVEAPAPVRGVHRGAVRELRASSRRGSGSWPTGRRSRSSAISPWWPNAGQLVPGRIGPRQPIDPTDGRLS